MSKINVNQGEMSAEDLINQMNKQCSVLQISFNIFPTILSSQNWLLNKVAVTARTKLCMGSLNNTYCRVCDLPTASWQQCAPSVVTKPPVWHPSLRISSCYLGRLPTLRLPTTEEAVFMYVNVLAVMLLLKPLFMQ